MSTIEDNNISLLQQSQPSPLTVSTLPMDMVVVDNVESINQNTELLALSTQTVISFVYCNKQPSLFNLLTQMLTTNTFSPINPSVEIPFQPSPYPISTKTNTTTTNNNNNNNNTSPQLSSANATKKPSLMFYILDQAINSVSTQYKKNFYIHILEKSDQPDHDLLVAGCLSFINHMLSSAPTYFDFEKYRQVLSSQGVNDIIKTYVKSVSPCVRLELLHYQKHKINGIKVAKQTSVLQDTNNILQFINRLCKMSFPSEEEKNRSVEEKMKLLGFESTDLNNELQCTGILGVRNMIYFCARYSRIYKEILQAQIDKIDSKNNEEETYYSFSRVGFTLTNLIYELYIEDENLYEIIFDQDDWFEELFCISFELFDEIWEREGRCVEDYITVLHKTRAVLSRLKWTNPPSISSFQKTLGNVLDEMWSKTEEIRQEKEMNVRVGGLSDSILGIPHGVSAGQPQGGQRFQKFFGDKFYKNYRRSMGSNNGDLPSSNDGESNGNINNSGSSLNNSNGVGENKSPLLGSDGIPRSPPSNSHQHKINTKSMSFRKLFTDLRLENERKGSINSSNGGNDDIGGRDGGSAPTTPRNFEQDDGSENGSTSSFSLGRLSGRLKRSGSTREKSQKYTAITNASGELIIEVSSNSGSSSPSVTPQSNVSPVIQSQQSNSNNNNDIEQIPPSPLNVEDGKKSLKSSGASIYKSMKKAMVNLEKKSKNISKKVKGKMSKEEKKKHSSNQDHSQQQQQQDYYDNNSSNASPFIIPHDLNLPDDFVPSLDLDFDKNSDSSYEDSSENETNTLDDIQSIDSSMNNNSNNNVSNLIDLSQSQILLQKQPTIQSAPPQQQIQPSPQLQPVQEINSTISTPIIKSIEPTIENDKDIINDLPPPIIVSELDDTLSNNHLVKEDPINNNNSNNNNSMNRSISEQSLTDAATLNYQLNVKQQKEYHDKQRKLSFEENKSDNSNNDNNSNNSNNNNNNNTNNNNNNKPTSPNIQRRHFHNIQNNNNSYQQKSVNSINSVGSSERRKPVLSRAPIPQTFTSPPPMVKSPSIKHLVNFFEIKSQFEVKDNNSTVSGSVSSFVIPSLQRQKSFKSDSEHPQHN